MRMLKKILEILIGKYEKQHRLRAISDPILFFNSTNEQTNSVDSGRASSNPQLFNSNISSQWLSDNRSLNADVDEILFHNEIRLNERSEWWSSLIENSLTNTRQNSFSSLIVRFFSLNQLFDSRRMAHVVCSLFILVIASVLFLIY